MSEEARRGLSGPPQSKTLTIREVGPDVLNITAPRVYQAPWLIANGDSAYTSVAKRIDIAVNTAEEYARQGFNAVNVKNKSDFPVPLTQNGWKLEAP